MKLLVAMIALVLTLLSPSPAAASSCATQSYGPPARSTQEWFRRADVWLYGDSLTYQTYRHLRQTSRARIAVDAWWGRDTRSAVRALVKDLRRSRGDLPRIVVMATGTNDLTRIDRFAHRVQRVRHLLPRKVRLVWVNVYVEIDPRFRVANEIIRSVPGVRVAQWAGVNIAHRGTEGSPYLRSDGIHVTDAGCAARNRMLKQSIRRAFH